MRLWLVIAAGLLARPAHAGCFTADEPPAKVVYDGGQVLEYLGHEGGVLTYRSDQTTTRIKHGLWPLEHLTGTTKTEYRWDSLLPDLARVQADGGIASATGRMRHDGAKWSPVVIEIDVQGEAFFDWEDCRYQVIEFRKTMLVDGKKVSDGVVLYAPDAMIAFRTDTTDPASGAKSAIELKELH